MRASAFTRPSGCKWIDHGIRSIVCLLIVPAFVHAQQDIGAGVNAFLPAPANVQAKNGAMPTEVVVTWNAVPGATSYKVMRGDTDASAAATAVGNVTDTSYDDKSVKIDKDYFYWVVASTGSAVSPLSTPAGITGGTLYWGNTFGVEGIKPAWGPFNRADPNNRNVLYVNTTPEHATTTRPATLAIVDDPQATTGHSLAITLMPAPDQPGKYYSGELCTAHDPAGVANNIKYGTIEARIKLPGGVHSDAIWPAFWMLGSNIPGVTEHRGELDIMESQGNIPGQNQSTMHGPLSTGARDYIPSGMETDYMLPNNQKLYSAYHIFTLHWTPTSVTFLLDGHPYGTYIPENLPPNGIWVFNHPFYVILNICEGGKFAPGDITSPQVMNVDYVRAYSLPASEQQP